MSVDLPPAPGATEPEAGSAALPGWLTLIVGQPLVVAVVLSLAATSYLYWRGRLHAPETVA